MEKARNTIFVWNFKNGKLYVTKEDPFKMTTDGRGNYYEHYYEEECTDYYGLLVDAFEYCGGENLTGLSYEEWIKTFDYDQFIKECAGHDYWWKVGELLGIPQPGQADDDTLPF